MLIAFAFVCALLEAFFTAQEVALGAVSKARLRTLAENEEAEFSAPIPAQAARVLALLERPDRLTLLFITVTSLSLWSAAALLTFAALQEAWSPAILLAALVILLFVAEVIPLLVAARHAEALALRFAGLIALTMRILSPLTLVFGAFGYGLARLLGSGPNPTPQVTEGELRVALAAAEEEGVIESEERALLEGAMDFREKVVREVMTPRPDIIGVRGDATPLQALEVALREGHSRLPIYDGNLDRIIGVLAAKDLLPLLQNPDSAPPTVAEIARQPFFVPENKRVAATLDELRRGRTLMAIVVEENGGTAGLVTLEDLLEELVGEIQDEYDLEESPLQILEEEPGKTILAQAQTGVRDFGRFVAREWKISAQLHDSNGELAPGSQSLAALCLERFGVVPQVGDTMIMGEASAQTSDIRANFGLEIEIESMSGARIETVKIRLVPAEAT